MKLIAIATIGLLCVSSLSSWAAGFGFDIRDAADGAKAMNDIMSGSNSASSTNGSSSPFCLVALGNKQCTYNDGNYCQQVAANLDGMCVTNPNFKSRVRGSQPFCVTSQSGTDCSYSDANYCRQMAQAASGGCIPNPNQ